MNGLKIDSEFKNLIPPLTQEEYKQLIGGKIMLKKFWDKFTDDHEYIRFKLAVVMILMIIGMTFDSWM